MYEKCKILCNLWFFSVLLLVSDCHMFQGSQILTDSLLILIVKEIDDISCWICNFFWNEFIALFYPSSQRSFQMLYVEFVWRVRSPTRKENLKLLYIAPSVTTVVSIYNPLSRFLRIQICLWTYLVYSVCSRSSVAFSVLCYDPVSLSCSLCSHCGVSPGGELNFMFGKSKQSN